MSNTETFKYNASYKGQSTTVVATSSIDAQKQAAALYGVKVKRSFEISVKRVNTAELATAA
jgi:hypothetical protein